MTPDGRLVTVVGFNGPNGAQPRAALTQGRDGLFYGTPSSGGANGVGTVFKMNAVGALVTLINYSGSATPGGSNLLVYRSIRLSRD